MAEKIIVTNYDRDEIILMIKEAFREELKEVVEDQNRKSDWDQLLTRKEAAEMLKVSMVTVSKYQREGILPYARIGRHIYIKKGDIMEAIDNQIKERYRRWGIYR